MRSGTAAQRVVQAAHDSHQIVAFQQLPHMNGQTLAAIVIDYVEGANPAPIPELIGHEIHAPALVLLLRVDPL
jgi:tRNA(Met) C34 N-acetyltransferase TmcA